MEYKGGGSGMIAVDTVAKAKPDGYTILCGSIASVIMGPILSPETAPFDPLKDFATLARAGETPNVLFVSDKSPYKTFEDLLSDAKKNPGKLNCGTIGVGSVGHFMLELTNLYTNTKVVHVPYKEGTGQVATAVLGGHVDMGIVAGSAVMGQVKAGNLRLLASTSKMSEAPDVATYDEKKLAQASVGIWIGYMVPAKTEKAVLDKLIPAFARAINDPENIKKLEKTGFIARYADPKEFSELMKSQMENITKTAKATNIIK